MRKLFILTLLFAAPLAWSVGIPAQITYQGTLREKGLPSNGTKNMFFRVTSFDGTQVYWSSGNMSVPVTNGLFSTQLSPMGVDWQNVTPYIEVTIQGQVLLPREPVAASVYANMSQSIVDGAVTPAKVASGFGLVPSGMIAIFTNNCPVGWNAYTPLQGKYPVGADGTSNFTLGVSTGNLTHNHSGITAGTNRGAEQTVSTPIGAKGGLYLEDVANQFQERATPHSHGISADSSLPPSLPIVFCQKQ